MSNFQTVFPFIASDFIGYRNDHNGISDFIISDSKFPQIRSSIRFLSIIH